MSKTHKFAPRNYEIDGKGIEMQTTDLCKQGTGTSTELAFARMVSSPEFNSAITNNLLNGSGAEHSEAPSLDAMIDYLEETCRSGDTGEKALTAQAILLDKLFNHLLQTAFGGDASKPVPHIDLWLKNALRAQSQCRSTYEAISNIRHPRVQYVAGGHMQVNNTHTDNNKTPNKLKEGSSHELYQNTGTSASARRKEQDEQAVVEFNRTKKC